MNTRPRKKAAAEYVYERIAKDVKRLGQAVGDRTVLGAALDHLALDRRGPNGHAYDTQPGARSEAWCWLHERPVTACDKAGLLCDGETVAVNDPTGEAALTPDLASRRRAEIAHSLTSIARELERLMPLVENHTTATVADCAYGQGVEVTMEDYELTRHAVLVACWYEWQYEDDDARRRWAESVHRTLGGWGVVPVEALPDPPRRDLVGADHV